MAQLTIKLSAKADALIAQLQKQILVMEYLMEKYGLKKVVSLDWGQIQMSKFHYLKNLEL